MQLMADLSPATVLGPVRLTVADVVGATAFYERTVGLRRLGEATDDGVVRLGAGDDPARPALVELVGDASAPPRARHASGLFHLALLVPDRPSLAQALRRVVGGRERVRLDGASDHLVSEALYLSDPEGNGIELYRDRPRETWRRDEDGQLAMATLPLDLEDLVGELADGSGATARELLAAPAEDPGMPADTTVGHVHLQVADLAAAEAFYAGGLGFDVMVRGYPGALFVAAGGYHHHVGLNTWASAGGPPADPAARGLRDFTIALPSADERDRIAHRVADAGYAVREEGGDVAVTDPFGIAVRLTAHA
jgi:catechol 2,3-dioxygenase